MEAERRVLYEEGMPENNCYCDHGSLFMADEAAQVIQFLQIFLIHTYKFY
jgi:hypothetical protein